MNELILMASQIFVGSSQLQKTRLQQVENLLHMNFTFIQTFCTLKKNHMSSLQHHGAIGDTLHRLKHQR